MFHLIRKYSNRKLYDVQLKQFIRQEELAEMVLAKEEVRIEDSDTRIDITLLEAGKALYRYTGSEEKTEELLAGAFRKYHPPGESAASLSQAGDHGGPDDGEGDTPAEIRILKKAQDYVFGAIGILESEKPYNEQLRRELVSYLGDVGERLVQMQKKYKVD